MEKFEERISKETYNEIKQFLKENQSDELDFNIIKRSSELYKKVFFELYESTRNFRTAFDDIMVEYQTKTRGKTIEFEIQLMPEINKRLAQIYSLYIKNQELWDMLHQLSSKRIKK